MKIPDQYNQVMPYLIIKGSHDFKEFMEHVFDAKEQLSVPGENGMVIHGELRLGKSVIMYAEATEQFAVMSGGVFIHVDNADITYQRALDAGAVTIPGQEPSDKEYGRTCGVKDPFGNVWWITSVQFLSH